MDTSSALDNDSNRQGVGKAEVLWSETAKGLEKAANIKPELDITDMVVSEYNPKYP